MKKNILSKFICSIVSVLAFVGFLATVTINNVIAYDHSNTPQGVKPNGDGTEENPWQIESVDNLYWLSALSNDDNALNATAADKAKALTFCAVLNGNIEFTYY